MTDSPRPGWSPDPTSPYAGYSDPAYAGSAPFGPSYAPASMPSNPAQTEPLPQYWTQTYPQTGSAQPMEMPPEPPRGPRPWLWAAAGFAVAVVIGLVVWVVFVATNPSRQETSIPAMPQSSTTPRTPPRTTTTTPELPSILPIPLPTLTLPNPTTSPNTSGETEPVTYEVSGQGRAINITYVDTRRRDADRVQRAAAVEQGSELAQPAKDSASVTVINVGSRRHLQRVGIGGVQVQSNAPARC